MTTTVERIPVYDDDTAIGNAYRYGAEYFVLVDGVRVGGTYWADAQLTGQRWNSWGVAGLSMHHQTREQAEQVQVDAYLAGVDQSALDRAARARDADAWCWK